MDPLCDSTRPPRGFLLILAPDSELFFKLMNAVDDLA